MEGTWHVARLKTSLVKSYARDLLKLSRITGGDVGFLLPLVTYTVRHNRERRTHHVPLFPGILFVCQRDPFLDVDPMRRTYANGRAIPPLRTGESGQKRLRDDLMKVEAFALTDAARMDPFPFAKIGTPVRVSNGPFRGMVGECIYADGPRRKFVILIDCLGQKVSYELEPEIDLEPID